MKKLFLQIVFILLFFNVISSNVFAHTLRVGNIKGEILGKNAVMTVRLLEKRDLRDEVAFARYSQSAISLYNEQVHCPMTIRDDTQGMLTIITYTFTCDEEIGSIRISMKLFFEDGYSYQATFSKGEVKNSVVFDEAHPEAVISFENYNSHESLSPWQTITKSIELGIVHIASGYDHLLFIFTLVLAATNIGGIIKTATAFTLAHGITLFLATFEIVRIPSYIVEPFIALSIAIVALENIFRSSTRRWHIVFVFGLIHGLGFAGALKELQIVPELIFSTLIGFNIGIELGQVAFIAVMLPFLFKLRKVRWGGLGIKIMSAGIAITGFVWCAMRLFAI